MSLTPEREQEMRAWKWEPYPVEELWGEIDRLRGRCAELEQERDFQAACQRYAALLKDYDDLERLAGQLADAAERAVILEYDASKSDSQNNEYQRRAEEFREALAEWRDRHKEGS